MGKPKNESPEKFVETYITESGSTWYFPNQKGYKYLKAAADRKGLVEKDGKFTLPSVYEEENKIARFAVARQNVEVEIDCTDVKLNLFISLYEQLECITLDTWQKEAVHQAMKNNLFILTGGPGTGKTCVLKCIRFCLNKLGIKDILFAAPTGKAARRITESVGGVKAYTVAKALGLYTEDTEPKKIKRDVVIVDEISMLDTKTAKALFSAVDIHTKFILVGDVEQLPSVGYGSILRDLIDAGLPCVKLEKTFRQASESGIFANIEQIKAGLYMGFIERDDFKILTAENTEEARDKMISEYLDACDKYGADQVVCLTPYRRKGEACAIKINRLLQEKLNPKSDGKRYIRYTAVEDDGYEYQITLRVGDPVMQLVNAYKVANGDVGRVVDISPSNIVTVRFCDCEVTYNWYQLQQLTLAYAMSVHKSQGSEYNCVITSAIEADFEMLSRNTIYTAVTRAKKECRIITNGDVAIRACKQESGYERITGLCDAIRHQKKKLLALSKLL